uniref:Putative sodium-dependent transporter HI_0736 n=1 Tax=Schistocephalus solidus TaxID=70667 RepID=A0A0X3Q0P3_SCHSO
MGRFTRGSPLTSFYKFLGRKFIWVGAWVTAVAFFISAYFSVVVGWCFYYFYLACAQPVLPESPTESAEIFRWFTASYYPLLMHTIGLVICGVCVFWGVKGIEIANSCLVPLQLFIVLFTFSWSLTREYADVGIQFMFTPSWHTLADPKLYVEAACQNAFDTAAGMGLFSAYAAYFTRKTSAVRYGMFLPMINNLVSLVCGLMLFATVFSTLISTEPTLTIPQIVDIMKDTGPGSTGLTFTWIPVLMAKLGVFGRVLCGLFFLCLSFAGITSMISYIELTARTIQDFGVKRTYATIASLIVTFLVGVPSAIDLRVLTNQVCSD